MARLVQNHTFSALPALRPLDLGRVLLVLSQLAVLGGIGLFLALAILNTVLGSGGTEGGYTPYGG